MTVKKRKENLENRHLRIVTAQDTTESMEVTSEKKPAEIQPETRCHDGVCAINWKPKRPEAA